MNTRYMTYFNNFIEFQLIELSLNILLIDPLSYNINPNISYKLDNN